ncbi:hypothetical protein ACXYMX_09135 [Sporosarcina sp. CAU 1771]
MKKSLLGILFAALMLSACSSTDEMDKSVDKEESTDPETEETGGTAAVDKGLLNVEVTIPGTFFEEENLDDVVAEAKENGMKEATVNPDGSVTYKMSKAKHKEMMSEMKASITESIDEMITGEDFMSFIDIKYNKNFSEFTLVVDKEAYENSFDGFASFGIGMSGMFYQIYDGVNPEKVNVKIETVDESSGEVFGTMNYPSDLEDLE